MSPTSIPEDYYCPISWLVMEEPVLLNCAHRFDRIHVINWLYLHNHCPTCRVPFTSLRRDAPYKKMMINFFDQHTECALERPAKLTATIQLIDSFKDLIDNLSLYFNYPEPNPNFDEYWMINLQLGIEFWRIQNGVI